MLPRRSWSHCPATPLQPHSGWAAQPLCSQQWRSHASITLTHPPHPCHATAFEVASAQRSVRASNSDSGQPKAPDVSQERSGTWLRRTRNPTRKPSTAHAPTRHPPPAPQDDPASALPTASRSPSQPTSALAWPPDPASTPESDEQAVARWTRHLEQLHAAKSLQAVIDLIETSWPPRSHDSRDADAPNLHSHTSDRTNSSWSSSSGRSRRSSAVLTGRPQGEHAVPNDGSAGVPRASLSTGGSSGGGTAEARRSGGAMASEADAVVDSLEALGHWLQRAATTTASTTLTTGTAAGNTANTAKSTNRGGQHVTYEQLVRCQVLVQRLLVAVRPLLEAQALPPKRLASLARAVNTLAAASPATNTRQAVPSGNAGYLPTAQPGQPAVQPRQSAAQPSQPAANAGQPAADTTGAGAPSRTADSPRTSPNEPRLTAKTDSNIDRFSEAGATSPAPSTIPAVLASLPPGWAQAYGAAVSHALPFASPAALCYLLRALSLDRGKRLLRASKWLSSALAGRVEQLAGRMAPEQCVIALSCGAQLAWPRQGPWLQALSQRLIAACGEEPSSLSPGDACAALHALGSLRAAPPGPLLGLMLRAVMEGMRPEGGAGPAAAGALMPGPSAPTPLHASRLTPLQLSGALWAVARLGLAPPEPWLIAFMAGTYPMLQARLFSCSQLSNVMWALARLDWQPAPRWLGAFLSVLSEMLPGMREGELAMVAWAVGTIRFRPTKKLLHSLAQAAAARAATMDARQLSMLALSWARLNFKPNKATTQALLDRLVTILEARYGPLAPPNNVNNDTLAGAHNVDGTSGGTGIKRRVRSDRTASKVVNGGGPAAEVSHQAVANLCYALAHLGLYGTNPRLVPMLGRAVAAEVFEFNVVELANVGKAMARMAQRREASLANTAAATASSPTAQVESVEGARVPVDPALVSTYMEAAVRHMDALTAATQSQWHQRQQQQPQAAEAPTQNQWLQQPQPQQQHAASGAAGQASQGRQQAPQGSGVAVGAAAAGGVGEAPPVEERRLFSRPSQYAALLLGAVKMNGHAQPPEYWMRRYYRATQPSLLAWPADELEELCEALHLMRPPPTPPLGWVKALSDRRDQLNDLRSTPKHLKGQLLLVLRIMRSAWQARQAQEQALEQGQGTEQEHKQEAGRLGGQTGRSRSRSRAGVAKQG